MHHTTAESVTGSPVTISPVGFWRFYYSGIHVTFSHYSPRCSADDHDCIQVSFIRFRHILAIAGLNYTSSVHGNEHKIGMVWWGAKTITMPFLKATSCIQWIIYIITTREGVETSKKHGHMTFVFHSISYLWIPNTKEL
jgi:hypothetical protein